MPARAFRRRLTESYFLPLLAMTLLAGLVLWLVYAQMSSSDWIQHTNLVITGAKDAQIELDSMQVNLRSTMLVPDSHYRGRIEESERQLTDTLAMLTNLVADNPAQQRRLLEISGLKGNWIATVGRLMQPGAANHLDAATFHEVEGLGAAIHKLLDQVILSEQALLSQRSAERGRQARVIFMVVPLLALLIAALLGYSGFRQIRAASDQFATALARAEDASRLRDNFLATVSHELRNPLNSILLACRVLLSRDNLDERARRSATIIEKAARAQAQLIEDLLDLSRIESGRLRLDVQMTDLIETVKAAVETMRPAAEAKSIELAVILDPRASQIVGDPERLQQVVWNLVSNAVKFTPKGGKVQVKLQRINSHVEIVVADNGAGIEPASLPHVFERFWQGEDQQHRRTGIGLGLSIVKQLVALHGGTVMAHSDGLGKGATFTVRLPLPVSTEPLLELRRHPTVAPAANAAAAPRLDGISILVVDDDRDACEALKLLFGSLGATVATVTSAQTALAMQNELRPDVVVSDIGMPGQDGFYLAKRWRERERSAGNSRRVPMVALTAYGRVEDKVEILASGFDNHVVKPVDIAELSATIRSLVTARESSA